MQSVHCRFFAGLLLAFLIGLQSEFAGSATLSSQEESARVVVLRNITVEDGKVSGEIANRSSRRLRDVQLLIRYSWRWKNEFRPGNDEFGTAVYHTVEKEIVPGETVSFAYTPVSPLPARPDGAFETAVSVAGFTEIIP